MTTIRKDIIEILLVSLEARLQAAQRWEKCDVEEYLVRAEIEALERLYNND